VRDKVDQCSVELKDGTDWPLQSCTALFAIMSKTGRTSVGDPDDTQDLAGGGLLVQSVREVARAHFDLALQVGIGP